MKYLINVSLCFFVLFSSLRIQDQPNIFLKSGIPQIDGTVNRIKSKFIAYEYDEAGNRVNRNVVSKLKREKIATLESVSETRVEGEATFVRDSLNDISVMPSE